MKKILIFVIALLTCLSSFAYESYEGYYIEQSLSAYGTVIDAIESRNENKATNDPRLMLSNSMNNFIVQRNGLRKARGIFDQFKDSQNFSIKASSALMSGSLLMIESQLDTAIKQTEKILNMTNSEFLSQAGTYTREIQETTTTINDLWDGYVKASASVPYALIEGMNKDPMLADKNTMKQKMTKLVVSRKFVNETKKNMSTRYKKLIDEFNKKDFNNMRQYQLPIVVMYQFMSDSWKTNDEK